MRYAITGAGGFVMGHVIGRLLNEGHEVRASDIKPADEWWQLHVGAENLDSLDLADGDNAMHALSGCDVTIHGACPMGGVGWITSKLYDCARSAMMTTHVLDAALGHGHERLLLTSSACAYDIALQQDPDVIALSEDMARPINAEPGYGMSKAYEELLCEYAAHDYPIQTRVARFHNIYGPPGSWTGGKEKAPAAVCRKIATAVLSGNPEIEVWGDGTATRSYCWIDDCVEGTLRLMASDYPDPVNIGSAELISVDDLYHLVAKIAGLTDYELVHDLSAPRGVAGRLSDNTLCREVLGWEPSIPLADGMARLYEWVYGQVASRA